VGSSPTSMILLKSKITKQNLFLFIVIKNKNKNKNKNKKKMKMKKIFFFIRLINLLSSYTFNLNDLFDLNIKEDDGEIRRNSFFVKFIISVGLII
jgi:hypothetical protein